jgi:cell wall-associated NlpC family hydrolase
MGKHRKPNIIKKFTAVALPATAMTAVLLSGSSMPHSATTADLMQLNPEPIHNTAPIKAVPPVHIPSQWQMYPRRIVTEIAVKKKVATVAKVTTDTTSAAVIAPPVPTFTLRSTPSPTPTPSSTPTHTVTSGSLGQKVVQYAESQIGVPYVYGGEDPGVDFDCSGLVQWAYAQAGSTVPRIADDQFNFFKMIPQSEARPGDLVFFHDDSDPASYVYHVGIFLGGQDMIVAPTQGQDVQIQNFDWGGDTITFGTLG